MNTPTALRPLHGVVAIDLTTSYAGPTATQLLADMGADVIKVERPKVGDDARHWGPPFVGGTSAWFVSANRNKRSVCLDLRAERGRAVLDRLLEGANVFIQSMAPSKLADLAIDPASVAARHPHLIYCALSGFGLSGPDSDRPGYDLIAQARSGLMSVTGEKDGSPQRVSTALSDVATGMIAALSITGALRRQAATGEGSLLDVSLLDVDLAFMAPRIASFLAGEPEPRPSGATDSVLAVYQSFRAADRSFVLAVGNDPMWQRFCAALGLEDLAEDPELRDNEGRRRHRARIIDRLSQLFATEPAQHWLDVLNRAAVPCSLINYLSEVVDDEHSRARGSFTVLDLAEGDRLPVVTTPWRVLPADPSAPTSTQPSHRPPPGLGADTTAVLDELGFTEDDVTQLVEEGVAWQPSMES